jgi:hypothetical protein
VDLLPDSLQVLSRLHERVRLPVEVVEVLGPIGFPGEQVVEVEPEGLGELADRLVALVDQLAAVLSDLAAGKAANAPAAAADPIRRLVDVCANAGLLELVGAGQPCQAGADDHDPWLAGGQRPRQRSG